MKKRIFCLALTCFMLLSSFLFVGCAQEEEEGADVAANTGAKTITMRIISEKKVCNSDAELAEYLENECGGDKESAKYKDMLATIKAYQAVEDEISKKTKSDYKTKLDIRFYTEDEYSEILEADMAEYALLQKKAEVAERALDKYVKEYKASSTEEYPDAAIVASFYRHFPEYEFYKEFSAAAGTSSEDTYVKNDLGISELVYPEADATQIDIIYISGYDMYKRYIDNEWILPLNSFISTTGKKLTYNISQTLLNGVKVEGETYAIPNNVIIGEYTYMLVDRELAEKYKHTYENLSDIVKCDTFVNDVAANHKDILPIDSTFDDCMDLFVWYWNIDRELNEFGETVYEINRDNKFSVLGTFYDQPSSVGRGSIVLGFDSLLANEKYRETLLCLKNYELNGCYRETNETRKDAAISFETGTYAMMRDAFYDEEGNKKDENDKDYGVYTDENGKEYFLYVARYPQANDDALYGNMYAVSANTKSTQACMEIITLINTDSEIRNLLQYGIKQGEHDDGQTPNYSIDEDTGVLTRLNDLYMMDIEKTGNCFIAYPEEGLPVDYWEDAKSQNNDAVIDPLAGFDFNQRLAEYGAVLDNDQIAYCEILSEQVLAKINGPDVTYELLENLIEGELAKEYGDKKDITITFNDDAGESQTEIVRITKLTNKDYDVGTGLGTKEEPEADPNGESPYTIYYRWLVAYGYVPAAQ